MRVVIIGAGLAGLVAAREIQSAGHKVVVLEKSRSSGGRCATRRIGDAVLDHGAQFFTVRSDEFARINDEWLRDDVTREWCRGFGAGDGHPRYCGTRGMTSISKHLATGLDVRYEQMAFNIERARDANGASGGWRVHLDDATHYDADRVIVTCPVPQSMALLVNAELSVPDAIRTIEYDKTIAALVVIDGDSAVPEPGGMQDPDATFSFVSDNRRKGVSPLGALTLHCNAAFSETKWWADPGETHAEVMELARPWIGSARVVEHQPKRWRMATPRTTWPECCWSSDGIVLAGDAFGGPRVEGAVLSGLAAAQRVLD